MLTAQKGVHRLDALTWSQQVQVGGATGLIQDGQPGSQRHVELCLKNKTQNFIMLIFQWLNVLFCQFLSDAEEEEELPVGGEPQVNISGWSQTKH